MAQPTPAAPWLALGDGVLAGLRVVDLSHHVAGPYCGKLLADHGADVIKVERPMGDPARQEGPFPADVPDPETSALFLYLNTGKRGITLDLKQPSGRGRLLELVREADVLIENFRPGVLERLGLGWETLSALNPRLVLTSISNFGQTGPYRDWAMTALTGYAHGGYLFVTGDRDKEPLMGAGRQPEYQAGLHACAATLTALHGRELTGQGQWVDVSILEVMATLHQYLTIAWSHCGVIKQRNGVRWDCLHPLAIYPCQDGHIVVNAATIPQWEMLALISGHPEMLEDPRFQNGGSRLAHADEFDAILQPWLDEHTAAELFEEAQAARLPFGLVPSIGDLFADPQYAHRGYFVRVDHPRAGPQTYPGPPVQFSATPARVRRAPLLGEHNAEILG